MTPWFVHVFRLLLSVQIDLDSVQQIVPQGVVVEVEVVLRLDMALVDTEDTVEGRSSSYLDDLINLWFTHHYIGMVKNWCI